MSVIVCFFLTLIVSATLQTQNANSVYGKVWTVSCYNATCSNAMIYQTIYKHFVCTMSNLFDMELRAWDLLGFSFCKLISWNCSAGIMWELPSLLIALHGLPCIYSAYFRKQQWPQVLFSVPCKILCSIKRLNLLTSSTTKAKRINFWSNRLQS